MSIDTQGEARSGHRQPGLSYWRLLARWVGFLLTLAGDILVVAALFAPWLEVFKIGDPSFSARQSYSPWMVLQHGGFNAAGVLTAAFFVVTGAVVLMSCRLALPHTPDSASPPVFVVLGLALAGLVMASLALAIVPMGLSLDYPYYDTNVLYGAWLAVGGFGSVYFGAAIARNQP